MVNKVLSGDGLYHLDLLALAIELVLVSGDFSPVTSILLLKIDVFFLELDQHCLFLDLELLICNCIYFFSHLNQEVVNRIDDVLTRSLWRLYHELSTYHVSGIGCPREDYIAQLLLSS